MLKIAQDLQDRKNVKGVHVLNGCFTDTWWPFLASWDSSGDGSLSFWGSGDEVYDSTTYETTAKYVANVALDENAEGFLKCEDAL